MIYYSKPAGKSRMWEEVPKDRPDFKRKHLVQLRRLQHPNESKNPNKRAGQC